MKSTKDLVGVNSSLLNYKKIYKTIPMIDKWNLKKNGRKASIFFIYLHLI
jgi:hypothetical protein